MSWNAALKRGGWRRLAGLAAIALALAGGGAGAAMAGTDTVIVTVDRDAYRARDLAFLEAEARAALARGPTPRAPSIAPGRLARVVQGRLDGLHLRPLSLSVLDADHVEVRFDLPFQADAFRAALTDRFGFALRWVDAGDAADPKALAPSPGDERMGADDGGSLWVRPDAFVSGEMIADARPGVSVEGNRPDVDFRLTPEGQRRLRAATTAYAGRRMAIVLDQLVLSAPVLRDPITGDRGEITCACTAEDVQAIARAMTAYRDDLPLKAVGMGAGD